MVILMSMCVLFCCDNDENKSPMLLRLFWKKKEKKSKSTCNLIFLYYTIFRCVHLHDNCCKLYAINMLLLLFTIFCSEITSVLDTWCVQYVSPLSTLCITVCIIYLHNFQAWTVSAWNSFLCFEYWAGSKLCTVFIEYILRISCWLDFQLKLRSCASCLALDTRFILYPTT